MNPTSHETRAVRFKRILRSVAVAFGWGVLGLVTLWAAAALYFDVRVTWLRLPLAAIYVLGLLAVWIFVRRPWKAALTGACFAVVLTWWFSLRPSNDRDWLPDVAQLPYADITGNQAAIHNIRNCDYRTETDFAVHYYDKTFDLDKLRSVDFYVVHWGSPMIAHTMMSFGFEGGDYVCFSIETRKEKGEDYSAVKGLFRQFELTYIIGDERDLIRLRTNYRGEQVYLYRLNTAPEIARLVFLDYLKTINGLKEKPEWYNAITDNCTTDVHKHTYPYAKKTRWDWRLLVNGYVDELVYNVGSMDHSLPFKELKVRSLINERAKAADQDPDFSRRIRDGLPGMSPQVRLVFPRCVQKITVIPPV